MSEFAGKTVTVKSGRFKGAEFRVEGTIQEMEEGPTSLPELAFSGNAAAVNALEIDNYTKHDAPFYYGKIGQLGYIIAEKDLK